MFCVVLRRRNASLRCFCLSCPPSVFRHGGGGGRRPWPDIMAAFLPRQRQVGCQDHTAADFPYGKDKGEPPMASRATAACLPHPSKDGGDPEWHSGRSRSPCAGNAFLQSARGCPTRTAEVSPFRREGQRRVNSCKSSRTPRARAWAGRQGPDGGARSGALARFVRHAPRGWAGDSPGRCSLCL